MGLDDVLKQQIRERAPELKQRLVQEFDELTHDDLKETGDDPDEIVNKISQKTGQPRDQVEQRVHQVARQTTATGA
jgi:flagellar basal body-associated protein FliL